MHNNFGVEPDFYPDDGGGAGNRDQDPADPGEPDIPSDEKAGNLEDIDRELAEAGQLPERASDSELRQRLRDRANKELRAAAELPAKGQAEIKRFLLTIKVPKAEEISPQEIELIWDKLNQNPTLIRDLTYLLINRDTNNNQSLYPLIPNMPEIMEYIDAIPKVDNPEQSEVSQYRPKIIRQARQNLARIGRFDPDEVGSLASGTRGNKLAEEIRLVGWLAGFEFIKPKIRMAVIQQMEDMGLPLEHENLTPAIVGSALIVILDREINDFLANRRSFDTRFNVDRRGLDTHENILQALQGIKELLYQTFLDDLQTHE